MKRSNSHTIPAGLIMLLTLVLACVCYAGPTNMTPTQPENPGPHKLVTVTEAEKLVTAKKVVVLDVRTPEEFAAGHIAGATNLDFHSKDFQEKLGKLDKTQPYLVNCAGGVRSGNTCKLMDQFEFKSVYDLKGGLQAWEKAGKPVEK